MMIIFDKNELIIRQITQKTLKIVSELNSKDWHKGEIRNGRGEQKAKRGDSIKKEELGELFSPLEKMSRWCTLKDAYKI